MRLERKVQLLGSVCFRRLSFLPIVPSPALCAIGGGEDEVVVVLYVLFRGQMPFATDGGRSSLQ